MIVLFESMYVHHVHAWCLQRSEEEIRSSVTGVMNVVNYRECWEQNPGPLKEQQGLF